MHGQISPRRHEVCCHGAGRLKCWPGTWSSAGERSCKGGTYQQESAAALQGRRPLAPPLRAPPACSRADRGRQCIDRRRILSINGAVKPSHQSRRRRNSEACCSPAGSGNALPSLEAVRYAGPLSGHGCCCEGCHSCSSCLAVVSRRRLPAHCKPLVRSSLDANVMHAYKRFIPPPASRALLAPAGQSCLHLLKSMFSAENDL